MHLHGDEDDSDEMETSVQAFTLIPQSDGDLSAGTSRLPGSELLLRDICGRIIDIPSQGTVLNIICVAGPVSRV